MVMRNDQRKAMFANMSNNRGKFVRVPSCISNDVIGFNSDENEWRRFSKKAKVQKKDFDAIYENLDGDYTCSYCGGVFGDKMTAASHAWNCNKNAFNDGNEFSLDNDTTQSFDI
jgi:hypothetical protein